MKKIITICAVVTIAIMSACTCKVATQTASGVVLDASMNTILIKTSNGDSLWLSTMDANPTKVPGVLIDDSISVVLKDTLEYKNWVSELTILKHSPYFYIQGEWVEPNPIDSAEVQGFVLNQDGTASSVNMATLVYKSWNFDLTTLVLSGQSIGNKQSIEFIDTLNVVKLNADSLVLSQNGNVVYKLARKK